ncbi:hypothetical protein EJ06DRAFT_510207 [Trichodelitschia bisporula]|uniref:Uncharacterized protein n=1 Tax=Trichodelitschia bisporula TaxID=703511 RepID=A0A6G1HWU0_9PEZI|nr:hypothetical protein EJ06DRAFT_510207 [Trichodelitschia bisporula]
MHHPYQAIETFSPAGAQGPVFLLAAGGPKLYAVNLENGAIVSSWPDEENNQKDDNKVEEVAGPLNKKRKVAAAAEQPNICKLTVSHDHQHAIVVTGEDKTVRVFSLGTEGELQELSQRLMPKRPSAVVISADNKTIIISDKFGDVYALPLLTTPEAESAFSASSRPAAPKPFKPAATALTVHSGANRRALEDQLKKAQEQPPQKTKEALNFPHQLLLGHVSLLTDMLIARMDQRSYIITADRDEHIRVSRDFPQTQVIENFCLGHEEFISKLCLISPTLLVSGGGDDYLCVWDWLNARLLQRISLTSVVSQARSKVSKTQTGVDAEESSSAVAVSGLWTIPGTDGNAPQLLVACEGVPALFAIDTSRLGKTEKDVDIGVFTHGNVLDVAFATQAMIVSIDNIHVPGSITQVDQRETSQARLLVFPRSLCQEWSERDHWNNLLVDINKQVVVDWHEKALQALLYSVHNLRKRDNDEE